MKKIQILFLPILAVLGSISNAEPFEVFRDCDACPEMIELPMGEFMMGAPLGELQPGFELIDRKWRQTGETLPFLNYREQPIHPVTIDIPFAMGRNEVTYVEWMACVNDGGCGGLVPDTEILVKRANNEVATIALKGTHPVFRVSYLDAFSYVDWLNEKTNTTFYRLRTEAEWECAARAGTQMPFGQGMDVTKVQAEHGNEVILRAQAYFAGIAPKKLDFDRLE